LASGIRVIRLRGLASFGKHAQTRANWRRKLRLRLRLRWHLVVVEVVVSRLRLLALG